MGFHSGKKFRIMVVSFAVVSALVASAAVICLKTSYDHLAGKARKLLWLLNENRTMEAHALFDTEAGKVFTAEDMQLVDGQMDEIIGRSGGSRWTGILQFTSIFPLAVVIRWNVDYSLAALPVVVTMSFIRRDSEWGIGGLWYDSKELRRRPLLVSVRFAGSLDDRMMPAEVKKEFDQESERVYAWTLWQGLNGDFTVGMRWVDPSGAAYHESRYEANGKPEQKSRVVWSRIGSEGRGKALLPGEWRVRITLNSNIVNEAVVNVRGAGDRSEHREGLE